MLGYVFNGLEEASVWKVHAPVAIALSAPVVIFLVYLMIRRLRRHLME
jgi:uncharacterized membrane-anchored protein